MGLSIIISCHRHEKRVVSFLKRQTCVCCWERVTDEVLSVSAYRMCLSIISSKRTNIDSTYGYDDDFSRVMSCLGKFEMSMFVSFFLTHQSCKRRTQHIQHSWRRLLRRG